MTTSSDNDGILRKYSLDDPLPEDVVRQVADCLGGDNSDYITQLEEENDRLRAMLSALYAHFTKAMDSAITLLEGAKND